MQGELLFPLLLPLLVTDPSAHQCSTEMTGVDVGCGEGTSKHWGCSSDEKGLRAGKSHHPRTEEKIML